MSYQNSKSEKMNRKQKFQAYMEFIDRKSSQIELARRYKVTPTTIHRAITRIGRMIKYGNPSSLNAWLDYTKYNHKPNYVELQDSFIEIPMKIYLAPPPTEFKNLPREWKKYFKTATKKKPPISQNWKAAVGKYIGYGASKKAAIEDLKNILYLKIIPPKPAKIIKPPVKPDILIGGRKLRKCTKHENFFEKHCPLCIEECDTWKICSKCGHPIEGDHGSEEACDRTNQQRESQIQEYIRVAKEYDAAMEIRGVQMRKYYDRLAQREERKAKKARARRVLYK